MTDTAAIMSSVSYTHLDVYKRQAIVAALLLAADFHDLFALPSLRRLWPCLGDVCGWLAKPLPMALVTLGASLALPRDSARLPVVVLSLIHI